MHLGAASGAVPLTLPFRAVLEASRWAWQYSITEALLVFLNFQAAMPKFASSVASTDNYFSHFRVELK